MTPDDTRSVKCLDAYESKPLPVGRNVVPLREWFSRDDFLRIAAAALAPRPPERWLNPGGMVMLPSRAWYEWHWHRGIDPDKRRTPMRTWMRDAVINRDGLVCQLCGDSVERDDIHIDHIVPYSLGGRTVVDNLQVAHSRCNLSKGARV